MILQTCVSALSYVEESEIETECTSEKSSEAGSSRVSGVRVSGAAKTLFVNEMEGLLRTQEPMPPWVEEDGSRETFCLVGLAKERGNMNEVTDETAIELPVKESIYLLLLPPTNTSRMWFPPLPQLRFWGLSIIQNLFLSFFNWWDNYFVGSPLNKTKKPFCKIPIWPNNRIQ